VRTDILEPLNVFERIEADLDSALGEVAAVLEDLDMPDDRYAAYGTLWRELHADLKRAQMSLLIVQNYKG